MKDLAETGAVPSKLEFMGKQAAGGFKYVGVRSSCATAEIGPSMERDMAKLMAWLGKSGATPSGSPFSITHKWDPVKGVADCTVGFPLPRLPRRPAGFTAGEVPSCTAYVVKHTGAYRHLGNAWAAGMMHGRAKLFAADKKVPLFEIYDNDPAVDPGRRAGDAGPSAGEVVKVGSDSQGRPEWCLAARFTFMSASPVLADGLRQPAAALLPQPAVESGGTRQQADEGERQQAARSPWNSLLKCGLASCRRMAPPMRILACLTLLAAASAAEIESTFFAETLRDPMEIAVAPDGDLYVVEREGRVLRVRPSTGGVFEIGTSAGHRAARRPSRTNWAREDGSRESRSIRLSRKTGACSFTTATPRSCSTACRASR